MNEPPNYHQVEMPDCCGVCKFYVPDGAIYDDSPETCEKFDRASFEWLCDEFERE
jgi:hypothetical protein